MKQRTYQETKQNIETIYESDLWSRLYVLSTQQPSNPKVQTTFPYLFSKPRTFQGYYSCFFNGRSFWTLRLREWLLKIRRSGVEKDISVRSNCASRFTVLRLARLCRQCSRGNESRPVATLGFSSQVLRRVVLHAKTSNNLIQQLPDLLDNAKPLNVPITYGSLRLVSN